MPDPQKTVRFASVVEQAGVPVTYLLWSDPAKDPKFKQAVAKNLVMTVHHESRTGHKDHGEIGYQAGRQAQYLLFPKSLRKFGESRVVGIDYALLGGETVSSGAPVADSGRTAKSKAVKSAVKKGVATEAKADEPTRDNLVHFPAKAEKPTDHAVAVKTKVEEALKPAMLKDMEMPVKKPAHELDPETAGQIRQAVKELKVGRYVNAYTRLAALLGPRG